ncbi:MAG: CapA family protein [Candidatus Phocaeicola faecigallinarum]|uniref:CapA family protein n=1 Tax=Candidatus Phocaeicola faecigallinarum TaxID=2838732 RepID=A0A948TB74_9BACT|nr:CapA family protein [Candidatus Phocaeicola faecigallinarum]
MNIINKYISQLLPIVLWLSATTVFAVSSDTLSIFFAGDLMQHDAQINAAKMADGRYDYSRCFMYVRPYIRSADIAVGNLEVTLGGPPYRGYPAFSAPDEYLFAIRDAGFDVLMTANNHCLDRGKPGLERTIDMLDSLKIKRAGTYKNVDDRIHNYPLLVEEKGFKVAFLNATYGTNGINVTKPNIVNFIDRQQLKQDIMKARLMKPDIIIAVMHWGQEYKTTPCSEEIELAEWLISMGVDHVIGSHPHVVQPVAIIGDSVCPQKHLVVFSLGNYISNMSARNTDGGLSVKLYFKRINGITRLLSCEKSLVWTSRPILNNKSDFILYPADIDAKCLNNNEKQKMNRYIQDTNRILKNGDSIFVIDKDEKK